MPQQDFKTFAAGGGANVIDQATYAANTALLANGFTTGIADSAVLNKTWRQSSIISSVIGEFISDTLSIDTIDDGTTLTLKTNLASAVRNTNLAIDTSTTPNVYVASLNIAPTALSDGLVITLKPSLTNTTAPSLNLNGLGTASIISPSGALAGGELTSGNFYQLAWSAAQSKWILIGTTTTAVTQPTPDNSTKIATTAFVKNQNYAPLTSPDFSGVPTAPTATTGDSTNTIASTAFVQNSIVADNLHLLKSGGTMTGSLTLAGNPTNTLHAATKAYVDSKAPSKQRIEWTDFIDVGTATYQGAFATVKTHTFTTPSTCSLVNIAYRTNCLHANSGGHTTEWQLLLNGTIVSYSQSNASGSDNVSFNIPMGAIASVSPSTVYTLTLQAKNYSTSGNVWTNAGQDGSSSTGKAMGRSEIDLMYF